MEACLGAQGQEEEFKFSLFFPLIHAKMDQGQLGCTQTVSKNILVSTVR